MTTTSFRGSEKTAARDLRPARFFTRERVGGSWALVQPGGGWCLNNVGIVPVGESLIVVDTMANARRNDALLAAVDELSGGRDVLTLNTHFHGDHTFGNAHLATRGPIVATAVTAGLIDEAGPALCGIWPNSDWGEIVVTRPDVVLDEGNHLDSAGDHVQLVEFSGAHTPSDLAVWQPSEKLLFAGDLAMNGVTPFALMGSVIGTIDALEAVLQLAPDVVVPGHGQVGGVSILEENIAYLRWCEDVADEAVRSGLAPLEAALRSADHPWRCWADPERLVGNLHAAMSQRTGQPLDLAAALNDMASFGDDAMTNGIESITPQEQTHEYDR